MKLTTFMVNAYTWLGECIANKSKAVEDIAFPAMASVTPNQRADAI